MITSFEVGSIFRVIDDATPQIGKILAEVRKLTRALRTAKTSLAEIGKMDVMPVGMKRAIEQADLLAASWAGVTREARAARTMMAEAAGTSRGRPASWPGRRGAPAAHGGSGRTGIHVSSLGTPIPGGHVNFRGGGVGLVAGGLLADAIYQGAELEKEAYLSWWHSGLTDDPKSHKQIRDIIQDATASTGYSFKEVGHSAENIFRLLKGTPGNGLPIAGELLNAGSVESLIKGTGLEESVKTIVEMAHMNGIYDLDQLKAMAPVFGFLSTANPASLPQMGRSASYSVPTLSNALGMNAAEVMFENTAIARAGATGSKSGTWVEHAFDRALPPDPHSMSASNYTRRMWAMRQAGLADAEGKSTILGADGKIDIEKFLNTAREALEKLPIEMRNSVEKTVFGEQGARGFELMSSPVVRDQMKKLKAEMPDFIPKYNSFLQMYGERSTIQKARTTYAEFNNLLADIGDKLLPSVNMGLRQLSDILKTLDGWLPKQKTSGEPNAHGPERVSPLSTAVNRAGWGAGAGALIGSFTPAGTLGGAAIGAVAGGAYGVAEQYMANMERPVDRFGREVVIVGNSAAQATESVKALGEALRGFPSLVPKGGVFPGGTTRAVPEKQSFNFNLHLDGRKLAAAVFGTDRHLTSAGEPDGSVDHSVRDYRDG